MAKKTETDPEMLVRQIYSALNDREFETAASYFADDAVEHASFQYDPVELRFSAVEPTSRSLDSDGASGTVEGLIAVWKGEYNGFPDITYDVRDIACSDGTVLVRFDASGTHENEWLGIEPQGKRFEITGHATYHIENGTVVEFHETIDMLGVLVQTGMNVQLEPS